MRQTFNLALLLLLISLSEVSAQNLQQDSAIIKGIYNESLTNGKTYEWLRYLCKNIGGRLSASPQAAAAVEYTRQIMLAIPADTVYLQEVMVPHWERGEKEQASILSSRSGTVQVNIIALGGSVATPSEGLSAEVIEVKNFDELKTLGKKKIEGKIIFFNRPMDPTHINTFDAYTGAVDQRSLGAVEAAKLGAAGVLIRSMNLFHDPHPHTGAMRYEEGSTKIPAAAISTKDADILSKMLKTESQLKVWMKMNCKTFEDKLSYNVIGEIRGSEFPDELIVVSGHLDSWDNCEGAHDDGAGCVQAIEVFRIFKQLNIKPKRTIRAVMYMNEENGVRGGRKYAELAKQKKENHIAAIESDAGGFSPRGFTVNSSASKFQKIKKWDPLFLPYGVYDIREGYGGVDISFLKSDSTALIGLFPDSQRYFAIHHAETDVFEEINKRELELGAAAIASLTYLLSFYGL